MGGNHSSKSKVTFDDDCDVNFDHFQILRAIGKGSFGKVCIVQKKDTKRMFAMKYMNKHHCVTKDAVRNVIREIEILTTLDHPFLVNLWFSFQDEEDMFMVVDLLLGGDLRYHMQQDVHFDEDCVKLFVCEMALALDYLQYKHIIHRDIKPDNILLDDEGHLHITDFNIATVIKEGQLATSMSGTKPYIAPEVFDCTADECLGYSFPVDWWSLGVCAYEMLKNKRPFDIHSGTNVSEIREMFAEYKVHFPCSASTPMNDVLKDLLRVDSKKRISSLKDLKEKPLMMDVDFDSVLRRNVKPSFVPAKDHLNCDPTFELEEMIIESKPLHKKKKRLSKQNSKKDQTSVASANETDTVPEQLVTIEEDFRVYNREKELRRRALEKKEREWQEELERFMMYDTKREKSHHGLGLNVRKGSENKENKKGGGGSHSPQANKKMISPTVTRRFPKSKKSSCPSGGDGAGSSHAKEKEEIKNTLAEAGKLLAIGAVEPLVMLTSASCRTASSVVATATKDGGKR